MLAEVICRCKIMSVMAFDGVASFSCLKDVTNTCKCMQNSPTIGFLQYNDRKLEEAEDFKYVYCVLELK